jgi:esterase/lipase superfamily enzyme
MLREYHRWYSRYLQRDMELLVLGHAGARVMVFPTRAGRFFDYEDWGIARALQPSIEAGHLQLYCLDSIDADSLYCTQCPPRQRILRHMAYERYVIREVLPFSAARNANPFVITHGCSLGAFHAVNIALRHPQLCGKVVALSGRYDLTEPVGNFPGLFNDYFDDDIYFNTPPRFIANLDDPHLLQLIRRLEIILVVGEADVFYEDNQNLSQILWSKGICHALHVWGGDAHRARAWRQMAPLYL